MLPQVHADLEKNVLAGISRPEAPLMCQSKTTPVPGK